MKVRWALIWQVGKGEDQGWRSHLLKLNFCGGVLKVYIDTNCLISISRRSSQVMERSDIVKDQKLVEAAKTYLVAQAPLNAKLNNVM